MNIDIKQFKKIYKNVNIIDIRNKNKYLLNHINNSINIDKNELILNPYKHLKKDEKYYIYCDKGLNSIRICMILKNMGFNVYNILGGYDSWIKENE